MKAASFPGESADLASLAGKILQEVLRRSHLSSAPDLATVFAEEARVIGVDALVLYLLDHEQRRLVPVPYPGAKDREPLPIQGTMAGRAFASTSIVQLEDDGGGRRLWLPLLDGTERLGVVDMIFRGRPERTAHRPLRPLPGTAAQNRDKSPLRPDKRRPTGRW